MVENSSYHGGLVFLGNDDGLLDRFAQMVSATMEDYGHPVERQSVIDAQTACVTASHHTVTLNLTKLSTDQDLRRRRLDALSGLNPSASSAQGPLYRLKIDLTPVDMESDDIDISELLMVMILFRSIDFCEVTNVEWRSPETMLTPDDFLSAFDEPGPQHVAIAKIIPRRVYSRLQKINIASKIPVLEGQTDSQIAGMLDSISGHSQHGQEGTATTSLAADQSLAINFRSNAEPEAKPADPNAFVAATQSDVTRLTVWAMTGMMVFLSAPVAVSMAGVNLIRGEDFRLNTHVLSLTGALVILENTGLLASAVSYLPL